MTFDEARATLGVQSDTAADEVRRAYARAVKRHPPERDPEGFQRVRAAYELLRSSSPAAGSPDFVVPALEPPRPPPFDDDVAQLAPKPPGESDPLAPYLERLATMDEEPWPYRAQVAREAYRAFPGNSRARELLLDELPEFARGEVTAVLQEAAAAGDVSCLHRLLSFAPGAVASDDLERLAAVARLGSACWPRARSSRRGT